jgi:hypothetical protein
MAEVRVKYGALFASRRIRASATVSICLAIGSPPQTVRQRPAAGYYPASA